MGRTSDAKEKLLDVAFQLIWDSSYAGVSVDQICERAGVNKGSFYHYFSSKADLAVAAYEVHWNQKQAEMDRVFSAQVPPLDRLTRWCELVYESQKEKCSKYGRVCGCPYSSIGSEVATQDEKIRGKAEELIARNTKYVEGAIAEAQREGLISGDADPRQLAEQVYAYILGTVLSAKIKNDLEILRHLAPTVLSIIGIQAASAVSA